jgi:uncharacterized cysteine cluster protein YcgN (CxxCxxCC family)
MADRVYHECPECKSLIYFYDEYWESACEGCGRWFVVKKMLVPVDRPPLDREKAEYMED